ncbi:hypothetical protein MGG_16708 [Pyricularia oryzae 70-15]|uniref:Uncharacterized protein n=3 Tax=Pyricularia oryzae TaxID=318829 RepID=G4N3R2_PYRO7|nr:uncharacterized protein MGG_16708 [Pyricularia oryzae 70-15]EHA51886.1 hypothetical protein MGG_16708 [Pyricularia oryzae 70-15]ELQ43221.1 hypothetical protein OOU_Y34scaffold00163g18 [Pyricularia oryzae Y34]
MQPTKVTQKALAAGPTATIRNITKSSRQYDSRNGYLLQMVSAHAGLPSLLN